MTGLAGTYDLPGAREPVEIRFDAHGVAVVVAENRDDLYRGQGFVHGALRGWQLDLDARTATGRLAALLGPSALVGDVLAVRLGFAETAAACVARADRAARALFEAYAQGVAGGLAAAGPTSEHERLGVHLSPPSADDLHLAAVARLLALDFSLQRDWLLGLVAEALEPPTPAHGPTAGDVLAGLHRAYPGLLAAGTTGSGSNAWAVRAADGGAVLAGDPHLVLRSPSTWLPLRLQWEGREAAGAAMTGVPDLMLGAHDTLAWAVTAAPAATSRLVLERLADDGRQVARGGAGTEPVTRGRAEVEVRGFGVESVEVAETSGGRLLGLALAAEDGSRYDVAFDSAVRAQPYDAGALAGLLDATSVDGAAAALASWRSVPQAVVVADADAGTAVVHVGVSVPDGTPALVRGWAVAVAPLPARTRHRVDRSTSDDGLVVAANDRPVGSAEPGHWEHPFRSDRIRALRQRHVVEVASEARIQLDLHSGLADRFLPGLVAAARAAVGTAEPLLDGLLDDLDAWDGEMVVDARAPLVFAGWWRELVRTVVPAPTPLVADCFVATKAWLTEWGLRVVAARLGEAVDPTLARETLDRTAQDLIARFGADTTGWTWGDQHRPVPDDPLAAPGSPRPAESALPGGDDTVSRGDCAVPPRVGVSMRLLVDLGRPGRSVWAFPPEAIGSAAHEDDGAPGWARAAYHPLRPPLRDRPRLVLRPSDHHDHRAQEQTDR